jgi:hypothetical protein
VLPLIHFIPDLLTYSVLPFLKRQYDRTLHSGRPARSHWRPGQAHTRGARQAIRSAPAPWPWGRWRRALGVSHRKSAFDGAFACHRCVDAYVPCVRSIVRPYKRAIDASMRLYASMPGAQRPKMKSVCWADHHADFVATTAARLQALVAPQVRRAWPSCTRAYVTQGICKIGCTAARSR